MLLLNETNVSYLDLNLVFFEKVVNKIACIFEA